MYYVRVWVNLKDDNVQYFGYKTHDEAWAELKRRLGAGENADTIRL